MNIRIYQVNMDRDSEHRAFMGLDRQGGTPIDSSIYDSVFAGEVECADLEAVFSMFNIDHPDGYQGRSLSVSDVVEVIRPPVVGSIRTAHGTQTFTDYSDYLCAQDMLRDRDEDFTAHDLHVKEQHEFWFCDSVGFKQVEFDPEKTQELSGTIRVVLVEPGKLAREAQIGTKLEELQAVVGGLIETYYPFDEEICIVCNDEGKYNGMKPNRAIYNGEGRMADIIFGPFFICDSSSDHFGSLSAEQVRRLTAQFRQPEQFFRVNDRVVALKYEPHAEKSEPAR